MPLADPATIAGPIGSRDAQRVAREKELQPEEAMPGRFSSRLPAPSAFRWYLKPITSRAPSFPFRLDSVGFAEALRTLEQVSNSFVVPVNEHLALVVRDTPQKRTEVGPAMTIAIPIPERLSVQDAQEIITAVQQTMEIRRASVDALRRNVILRDALAKCWRQNCCSGNYQIPRASGGGGGSAFRHQELIAWLRSDCCRPPWRWWISPAYFRTHQPRFSTD